MINLNIVFVDGNETSSLDPDVVIFSTRDRSKIYEIKRKTDWDKMQKVL